MLCVDCGLTVASEHWSMLDCLKDSWKCHLGPPQTRAVSSKVFFLTPILCLFTYLFKKKIMVH